jgi:hypothetical protein
MSKRRTRRARGLEGPSDANRGPVPVAQRAESQSPLSASSVSANSSEIPPTRVSVVHRWKDYLAQSMLIVFSVLLALGLSELMTSIRESRQTQELIANVRA